MRQEQTVSGGLRNGFDAPRLLVSDAKAVGQKVGSATCSWRMKPRCGSLPVRNRSTAAQMPAAVVICMAETASA